ncbi:hypothetical protein TW95_gp0079 [Pandoravirus inopinatum]|uniref:Uncharacterized protein n=1 Tax=Pandoravirus inopinatum TaxID=1605721 RepID=A0A0B5IVX2_9VIRU|nr:hypothetical protein TW95_gp0079 [Pandoravirus inopinatum]AJF96813.1 hypothetical protein [Pandoravirus inopinatum]
MTSALFAETKAPDPRHTGDYHVASSKTYVGPKAKQTTGNVPFFFFFCQTRLLGKEFLFRKKIVRWRQRRQDRDSRPAETARSQPAAPSSERSGRTRPLRLPLPLVDF